LCPGIAAPRPIVHDLRLPIALLWSEWVKQEVASGLIDHWSQIDLDPDREMLKFSIIMTAKAVKNVVEKLWA
jgi:hypothetical protein